SSTVGQKLDCRTNGYIPMFVTNFTVTIFSVAALPAGVSNFLYLDTYGSFDSNRLRIDTLSVNYQNPYFPPIACNNDVEGFQPWSFVSFPVTNAQFYKAVVYAQT